MSNNEVSLSINIEPIEDEEVQALFATFQVFNHFKLDNEAQIRIGEYIVKRIQSKPGAT